MPQSALERLDVPQVAGVPVRLALGGGERAGRATLIDVGSARADRPAIHEPSSLTTDEARSSGGAPPSPE